MNEITKVNIYRHRAMWCYAAWCGPECDHTDTLGDCDTESDAIATIRARWPDVDVLRVEDVP